MDYYPPYHPLYPSPHSPLPTRASTLPIQQRILQLQRQNDLSLLAQSQAIVRQNQNFLANQHITRSLLVTEKIQQELNHRFYDHGRNAFLAKAAESAVEFNYLKKIEELRREREMLFPDRISNYWNTSDLAGGLSGRDEREMSDEELVNYYQSGARGHHYTQELNRQLKSKADTTNEAQKVSKTDRLHNKDHIDRSLQDSVEKEEAIKRSYIDELNDSTRYGNTAESGFKRSTLERGNTIDVVSRTKEQSPLKGTYFGGSKKKDNTRKKTTNLSSHNKSNRKNQRNLSYRQQNRVGYTPAVTQSAMKKINNRLKVSKIVYKDSKWRHVRHEAEHLFNTFQNEVKSRKQVKDKINNNSSTLKKHNLVVESR